MRRVTNDEDEIRYWASQRNAHPVQRAKHTSDTEPAHLSFVFGRIPEEAELKPIDWATFFAMFHLIGLMLAYDEEGDFELLKVEGRKSRRYEGKPMIS